jgi:hypothetical protein
MKEKIYFVTEGKYIKIGYTTQDIEKRIKQLNTGSVQNISLLGWMYGNKAKEKELHIKFAQSRVRYNGEWFEPTEKLLDFINENNLEPNSYVDFIDGELKRLFSFYKI